MDPHSPLSQRFQIQVCYDRPDYPAGPVTADDKEKQLELDLDKKTGDTLWDNADIYTMNILSAPERQPARQTFIQKIASTLGL